jgi:hypothetical protein
MRVMTSTILEPFSLRCFSHGPVGAVISLSGKKFPYKKSSNAAQGAQE